MENKFLEQLYQSQRECPDCPSPEVVSGFFTELLGVLFPDHRKQSFQAFSEFASHIEGLKFQLIQLLVKTPDNRHMENVTDVVNQFFDELPSIYHKLLEDIDAMYSGDPAAKSHREVIRTYPGFYAIAAYRMAHALHTLKVRGIPRVITEHAHSKTGIDIHPGAKIGNHFCIDHGTGIVIGETTVIGNYVKLYQGVTLGALSINKEDAHLKRHPTIEDQVVIYAGATILGGETIVGHDSVIGGNVWLTASVLPHSKVYYQSRVINELNEDIHLIINKVKDIK